MKDNWERNLGICPTIWELFNTATVYSLIAFSGSLFNGSSSPMTGFQIHTGMVASHKWFNLYKQFRFCHQVKCITAVPSCSSSCNLITMREQYVKKRNMLNLQQKVSVIKMSEKIPSVRKLAEEFNSGKTQISTILQNKSEILGMYECNASGKQENKLEILSLVKWMICYISGFS